jgi:DNA-binding CsgD family transcriptional regulator
MQTAWGHRARPSLRKGDKGYGRRVRLIDRRAEKQAVYQVLDSVRAGMSGALVLRGEPGVGKSALLDYAVECAADLQTVRTVAVESERAMGFAAVHQLLVPLLPAVDRLPEPQRRALRVAFGLVSGPPADPFLVGLAVLTLLADAAEVRPVLCVIDDAHWLDDESADILSFVARRLLADRVAMLFAIREMTEPDPRLQSLRGLRIAGLPEQDAYELLETSIGRPVNAGVAARIIAETGGNPLAIVEAARELSPKQLGGRAPLPEPLPVGHQLDVLFVRRVRELPTDTQTLLLLAAADQPGPGDRLWQAATALGIPESAAVPAEAAGLMVFWPEVRFSHPLVRSAVYHAATAVQRRRAHRALTAACDPELHAVPRAWHLAAAATGPGEGVAAQLEAAADRARSRGGYAAAAALLERAALLTPDGERRAERRLSAADAHLLAGAVDRTGALLTETAPGLRDPRSTAQAIRLKGKIDFACGQVADAASALVCAAVRLRPLDPSAARDALLSALEAVVFAGWASSTALLHEIARTARDLPPMRASPDSATDLLLQGYAARVTGGYAAAVPALRRAVQVFLVDEVDPDVALRRLLLVAIAAVDLLDDAAVERLTTHWIDRARHSGALTKLAGALAFRSTVVDGPGGQLAAARAAESEAHELAEVTGNPRVVPPSGAHTLLTLALSCQEAQARATAAAVAREAPGRGAAGEAAFAAYCLGVLEISLCNYGSAVVCLHPAYTDDTPLVGTQALPDLVEAAVRAGRRDLAERALQRLDDRATATGTPLALGLLARSRALLAAPAEARQDYEDALPLLGRTRAAPQLARAHLLYGEWLRRQRQRREARDQLHAALDMFDGMGLHGFAERARVELRATGEHARKRELGTPEELTPQEAQIAALVSRGQANREIAAQLFVTPSTVEYHLRKVFRKLRVTSRTQLAHRVINQGFGVLHPIPASEQRPLLDGHR